ncbi:hypothetical protein FNH04_14195 [Streptomyces phyllanthi]|uniref:Uncharacterized protein n=1 Tax=Streptomyces phyllanthi TaxID=1803180 RepID=A0A5N8W0I3_9ACTN|nr:hypothetical protein [Streptomyces phyllanthi]
MENSGSAHTPGAAPEAAAPARGRRRRRGQGAGSEEGPVFVDNSGRRARLLRRIGMLLGVASLGYAVVLGMAFMGWGISASPTELFPFGGGGGQAGAPAGGPQLQGGRGGVVPSGAPGGTPPSGASTAPSPAVSAGTASPANAD